MAKQKRDRVHNRHRMVLDSIPGIIAEQCRVYRLWTNGRIKADEMVKGMGGLTQIRTSIESLPPEPRPEPPITSYNIVSVPPGFEINSDGGFSRMPMLIEHDPQPPVRLDERIVEPDQDAEPKLTVLEAKLMAMNHDQLLELARTLNVGE